MAFHFLRSSFFLPTHCITYCLFATSIPITWPWQVSQPLLPHNSRPPVAAQPTPYLSLTSANALISDLRPTTFSDVALTHLNTLLDELLIALLTSAQSLNPSDLRREAIPSFFSGDRGTGDTTGVRALGRNAVAEAEVELRSWQEGRSVRGYPPDGKGPGTRTDRSFPLLQAVDLMRVKCAAFSVSSCW